MEQQIQTEKTILLLGGSHSGMAIDDTGLDEFILTDGDIYKRDRLVIGLVNSPSFSVPVMVYMGKSWHQQL